MLARTPTTLAYLSAEELGISARERVGLIEVRDDLAVKTIKPNKFNMGATGGDGCGTPRCIGGHLGTRLGLSGKELTEYVEGSLAMRFLFYPDHRGWASESQNRAVSAIDHFLAGAGAECWPMALQDIPLV